VSVPASVEIINPAVRRGPFRAAIFDFDGTLSLVREGWCGLMADIGLSVLRERTVIAEPEHLLRAVLEEEMLRLSGQPSIVQMGRLADIVQTRGGRRPDSEALLAAFYAALSALTADRKRRLSDGTDAPDTWAVPGAHRVLLELQKRGVTLILASGTDLPDVLLEAELLQLTHFFEGRIYAPIPGGPAFRKHELFDRLLRELAIPSEQLISFGDGFAETVAIKQLGGVAVGLASVAVGHIGDNPLKRAMLMELGADLIVRDYTEAELLVNWLWPVKRA